jgi:2-(1,2-epoxy-1,2-dihydrophenyl)acetyl-CoA isomerase
MTEAVLLESRDGGILFLTMNRPAALNALDPSLARALRRSIAAAAEDPSVAVLVLRGSGRAFCAGGDISSMKASERVSRANWPRFAGR